MWYNESDPALVRSPGQHHNPTRKGAAMPGESSKKIELARRAVACKHWRWMPGMRGIASEYVSFRVGDDGRRDDKYGKPVGLPDLDDAATVGCLLALVREAWGEPTLSTRGDTSASGGQHWDVAGEGGRLESRYGSSEAEALVAALEAAP